MTEREMWRTAAEAFSTPQEQRTSRQNFLTDTYSLCIALKFCGMEDPYYRMVRLGNEMGAPLYWWPTTSESDGERALFAGFMAAMTDRERAQLWEGL